ncbi:MAG: cell division protein CrgA [Actinomycetaceae bacterium]|nr:cell division protein CrgA [Arcanobacterium sp.]MDD7687248.1 cell division protein CrgA [Actinomycetaceae bacterium]MDY5273454.1 cell division protein CrgA [Arcanobacterium sp.]
MPESKKRKKVIDQRKAAAGAQSHRPKAEKQLRSPKWWAPLMVTLAIVGLIVVVMAYVTAQSGMQLPIPGAGNWNLLIGLVLMIAGFLMTMGWK